ncbi:putative quinol monooxygenase [Janthinobacterium lividum]|uniref:Antibiotic biosynthesis monooxygenase n=1 Tax=Janthinobacterium lividum TaxID=29581 RepID=A0AAJ4T3U5_9BURK|nr:MULTISPECIES: putative quinol monooxygenase [Janthinobacterium]KAB0325380.1 antibiotic biosynthesis monooxygenase [Janthinobacterium lividum]MBR7634805.1 antibiotic biosynthesis monooxygenase [Janthinobacterium lividum]MCC7697156.1 antibiotic biosynthesis monooxygenase [Janthinobacterium sp. EB271-G4-7A]MCC7712552.1 antibiotic biosynthesis monooxygenase [Janthinobacterium lividum]MDO8033490.1 putative quinol monooxygenase [Janthinobacterium sp. SUN128]
MTLIVVATIDAQADHIDAVRAALEAVVPPSRAESGCLRYELHLDNKIPTRFIMLEEWADKAALTAHYATPHFLTLVAATEGKAVKIDVAELSKLK